jgi:hypothetical protein
MASPLVQALAYQNSVNPVPSAIAPTDVVSAYKLSTDAAEKNYQAKLAAQNAMWGGLAGIGGAGIQAFGPTAAKSIFGGSTPAASAAAPAATMPTSLSLAPTASGTSMAWPGIPAASGLADAGTAAGADATGSLASALAPAAGSTVAADLGLTGAGDVAAAAAPTVAGDLAASGATAVGTDLAAAGADAAAASIPEWLAALLALA